MMHAKRLVFALPDDTQEPEPAAKRMRLMDSPWPDFAYSHTQGTIADNREAAHTTSYSGTFEEVDVFWQKVGEEVWEKWSLQKHSDGWSWWWSESRGVWWEP